MERKSERKRDGGRERKLSYIAIENKCEDKK